MIKFIRIAIFIIVLVCCYTQSNAQDINDVNNEALKKFISLNHLNPTDSPIIFSQQCISLVRDKSNKVFFFKIAPSSKTIKQAQVTTLFSLLKLNSDIFNVTNNDFRSVFFNIKGIPVGMDVVFLSEGEQ